MSTKKPDIMDMYKILKHPLSTEKGIGLMKRENKLLFIVDKKATDKEVKESVEKMFKVKIKKVNTLICPDGKKKAYVKFSDETPAIDVATKLGLM